MQFRLSKSKRKRVKRLGPTAVTRGGALNMPVGIEVTYVREIRKIINAVIRETQKGVKEVFQTPSAEELFAEDASFTSIANKSLDALFERLSARSQVEANKIARKMVLKTNKSSQRSMAGSLKELSGGVTLDPSLLGGDIPEVLQASIEANAGLIADVTDSYLAKVSDAVNRSIQNGRGLEDLIPFFQKQNGVVRRRGKNMALDQVRKAYNSLNVARMENVGLSKFEWLHSMGGQSPRELHITPWPKGLNHGIFDINDPPVIDAKTGERGLPSDAIGCKCRMAPLLVFDEEVPAA